MGCLGSRAGTSSFDAALAAFVAALLVAAGFVVAVRGAGAAFRATATLFGAVAAAVDAGAVAAFVAAVVCEAARDGEMTGSKIRQARNASATAARWRKRIIIPPETPEILVQKTRESITNEVLVRGINSSFGEIRE